MCFFVVILHLITAVLWPFLMSVITCCVALYLFCISLQFAVVLHLLVVFLLALILCLCSYYCIALKLFCGCFVSVFTCFLSLCGHPAFLVIVLHLLVVMQCVLVVIWLTFHKETLTVTSYRGSAPGPTRPVSLRPVQLSICGCGHLHYCLSSFTLLYVSFRYIQTPEHSWPLHFPECKATTSSHSCVYA